MPQYHVEIKNEKEQYIITVSKTKNIEVGAEIIKQLKMDDYQLKKLNLGHVRVYLIKEYNKPFKIILPLMNLDYFEYKGVGYWRGTPTNIYPKSPSRFIYTLNGIFVADEVLSANGKWKIIPFPETKYLFRDR